MLRKANGSFTGAKQRTLGKPLSKAGWGQAGGLREGAAIRTDEDSRLQAWWQLLVTSRRCRTQHAASAIRGRRGPFHFQAPCKPAAAQPGVCGQEDPRLCHMPETACRSRWHPSQLLLREPSNTGRDAGTCPSPLAPFPQHLLPGQHPLLPGVWSDERSSLLSHLYNELLSKTLTLSG